MSEWKVVGRVTRRGLSLLVAALAIGATPAGAATHDLTRYVNPFTGSAASSPNFGTGGGAGNTFPGAVAPFGMLQWSPDTLPGTVNFAGGYSYGDRRIRGFSLTHISGAGCAAAEDFPFLPTTSPVTTPPAEFGSSNLDPRYEATFSHARENASPGYYRVDLNPGSGGITSELTASTRSGAGRFTYPAGSQANLLINAGGSAMADTAASVRIDPAARLVTGSASSGRFCYQRNTYNVYFAAQFNRPFGRYGTWTKQLLEPRSTSASDSAPLALNYTPVPGGPSSVPGNPSGTAQAGAYVGFDTRGGRTVEARVGVSYVSAAGALANLRAEAGRASFRSLRAAAHRSWNAALGRIRVDGGRARDLRTFYTALYHALLAPSVFSDVTGSYTGMDGRTHRAAAGHAQYANYSGWDVYRSEIPLLAMLFPHRASDMVRSLVADQQQSGWLPKWSLASGQTDVMVGDPADPTIAGAWVFGARDFDPRAALTAMVKGATQTGVSQNGGYVERPGTTEYQQLGYIPHEENGSSVTATLEPTVPWGSVSTTLEYANADFAIARFAASAACDRATYRSFLRRSGNWQRIYDPAVGYVEPRSAGGAFASGSGPTSTGDFVEGDAAQYTWMVPYDLAGLFARMGGRRSARARLDRFFARLNGGPSATTAYLGNEPTLETPWIYDWLGRPDRTEAIVRRALLTLYGSGPGGFPGNDDLGEMSSWYVLGAVGLYPEVPATPILAIGSPLFRHTSIAVGGRTVRIDAPAAAESRPYVAGLTLNGHRVQRPWLSYASLEPGARLRFQLRAKARRWGRGRRGEPPSYGSTAAAPACSKRRGGHGA